MLHGTFVRPDLTTFTRLDELGLEVVAQRVEPGQASLVCRVVDPDDWCYRCGCQGGGAGHGHPAAGSCPVRVAADDAVGVRAPLPVWRLWPRVASEHEPGG